MGHSGNQAEERRPPEFGARLPTLSDALVSSFAVDRQKTGSPWTIKDAALRLYERRKS